MKNRIEEEPIIEVLIEAQNGKRNQLLADLAMDNAAFKNVAGTEFP